MADDLVGPLTIARRLLRTIGRLLDEAGRPNVRQGRVESNERTSRELHAALSALGIPTDRRAFDLSAEVQAVVNAADFGTNDLARERLRHLRDVLNARDLD